MIDSKSTSVKTSAPASALPTSIYPDFLFRSFHQKSGLCFNLLHNSPVTVGLKNLHVPELEAQTCMRTGFINQLLIEALVSRP